MYRILFSIGSFSIYSYGAFLALAFTIGILLAMKEAKKSNENPERILDLSLYVIIGVLIGGRLAYVLTNFSYYMNDPIKILYLRQGGLSFLGAFLMAFLLACWYIKKNKLSLWKYADITTPSIAIGYAIARIGCFLNGCCYGVISENYGIKYPSLNMPPAYSQHLKDGLIASGSTCSLPVIPTQIYSSLYGLLIFFIILRLQKNKKYDGYLFFNFLILYSVARFVIEFFRFYENGIMIFNLLTITQIVCIVMIVFAFFMMRFLKKINNQHLVD